MKKLLLLFLIITSLQAFSQTGFVGTTLTGQGYLAEAGVKASNIKATVAYRFSAVGIHQYTSGYIGASIDIVTDKSYIMCDDWEHTLSVTPSIGYSIGTFKKEIANSKIINQADNSVLYQLELSYRISRLELAINLTRTNTTFIGIGWRGHF